VNFAASQEIPRIHGTRKSRTIPISARHLSQRKHLNLWVILNIFFLRRGVFSTSPNPQVGGPLLVGCPRLLIQFIHSYLPYRRPFLHPTSRSCLNKFVEHYFVEAVKPKVILSDNETQMQCQLWKGTKQKHYVKARYSAIYCSVGSHCWFGGLNIHFFVLRVKPVFKIVLGPSTTAFLLTSTLAEAHSSEVKNEHKNQKENSGGAFKRHMWHKYGLRLRH
jgi:hypothetical protein